MAKEDRDQKYPVARNKKGTQKGAFLQTAIA